ncbi:NADP-dependent oxidoreductase [Spongiibacter sp. KMU-166]|uniref:NADP-dependent oxidoreductase n=1 Tax=Spongiibacter thalassae TaxID=2721624 RepID=A0ABX1GHK8_9GAMM|nr:NADP-dependent oxidoreductase [Spongiibacter thalassae]NKI18658.1 NADP-dependent oxidoreductase [Spongiibacter thalassae]
MINKCVVLKERPRFQIPTEKCFRVEESLIRQPGSGELLIQTTSLGMDPYLFSKVKKVSEQARPIGIGDVMYGATVGRVIASNVPEFKEEDYVYGLWGWQEYYISSGSDIKKIDPDVPSPSYMLGSLGAAGFGAYLANRNVLNIKPGDKVFCSAATGALGQMIGQLARLKGGEVYGTAGSEEKCELAVAQMGYTACFNHADKDLGGTIGRAIDGGIDAMMVSAGGRSFDAAFPLMALNGRVAVCGLMALYSMMELPAGPDRTMAVLNEILLKRLRVEGSLVLDYLNTDIHREFLQEMSAWIRLGAIKPVEHVTTGLENAPVALRELFEGRNIGKSIVKVSE